MRGFVEAPGFVFDLEACWRDVREECFALPRDTYEPWVQREMYGEGWSVFGLVAFGKRIEKALGACPRTARALERVPHLTTAGFRGSRRGRIFRPGCEHVPLDEPPPEVRRAIRRLG